MELKPGVKFLYSNGKYLIKVTTTLWKEVDDTIMGNYVELSATTDQNGNNLKVLLKKDDGLYILIKEDRVLLGFDQNNINNLLVMGAWTSKDGS